jgi:DNA-binding SARP family transcriptional activator
VEVGVLGPLRVAAGEREIPLQRQKHRALLAFLALHAREVVSIDRLLDELWGERPPATARNSLQNSVSQLRKLLGEDVLRTRAPGYVLELPDEAVDARRFEGLLAETRTQAPPARAETLRRALALWRGRALADLEFEPFALAEAPRLTELRADAEEQLVAAELELGRHAELVPRIEDLVARHPLRERLRGQLMLALYRSGRQADALAAFRDARRVLVDELGIEPGPTLRALEQAILRHDPALAKADAVPAAAPRPADLRERRTTITAFFAAIDVLGELDAERHRALTTRASHELRAAIEYHGGTIERLGGDEALAVFGLPERHEDDAVRAARAALQAQRTLRPLPELELRIALATGDVLAPGPAVRAPASGTPITLAKRLSDAAEPSLILVDERTRELFRGIAVTAELAPVAVRSRKDRVPVSRLDAVHERAQRPRVRRTPLVGRTRELDVLRGAFDEVVAGGRGAVWTVVGDAGVGKTRLAVEFAAAVEDVARLAIGRCVAYGAGATWLPLRELVQRGGVETLDKRAAETLDGLLHGGVVPVADAFWAARRFVESLAHARPAVVVLEDVHWASPTFLDFVEQLANVPPAGPVFVLCLARPELVEQRPAMQSLVLEPLGDEQARELVDAAADESLATAERTRIAELAEGNPLFAEQLVAFAHEHGAERLAAVPPTVDALLASRLDRLDAEERAVLQRAAVVGREFWHASVLHLTPALEVPAVGRHLDELERKGLIRPARSSSEREDAFRFHHVLIRDVAYASLPKGERAELHEGVAEWLGDAADDEIVGFHLEQSYLLRAEIGEVDRHARLVAEEAGERLAAAGVAVWKRADAPAASNLLGRALALLPKANLQRVELLCEHGVALRLAGATTEGTAAFVAAAAEADEKHDVRGELRARFELLSARVFSGAEGATNELLEFTSDALPVFEEFGDDRAQGRAWLNLGYAYGGVHCRNADWERAAERALVHYTRAGWPTSAARIELASALYHGPTPVREAIARCRNLLDGADRSGEAGVLVMLGGLEAMRGRPGVGLRLVEQGRTVFEELGLRQALAGAALWMEGQIAMLGGAHRVAAQRLRASCDLLAELGNRMHLATFAGELAEALYALGRLEEALGWTDTAEAIAAPDDVSAQFSWRSVRAKLIARGGFVEQALALADEAVALASATDAVNQHARVLLDRAEVLQLGGFAQRAAVDAERALELFDAKGNVAGLRRVRRLLDTLAVA